MNCALSAAAVIENATRAGQPPRPARDLAVHDHAESYAHATPRRAFGVSAIHELVMRAGQGVDALGLSPDEKGGGGEALEVARPERRVFRMRGTPCLSIVRVASSRGVYAPRLVSFHE